MSENSLRDELRKGKPKWVDLEFVEPFSVPGVPDLNFCLEGGTEGWLELKYVKKLEDWKLTLIRTAQLQWLSRREQMGALVSILIKSGTLRHSYYLVRNDFYSLHDWRAIQSQSIRIWHGQLDHHELWNQLDAENSA